MIQKKEILGVSQAWYLFFFLSGILGLALNLLTLYDGHNWGDDFAQYVLNAKNILEGKSYTAGIMLDNPTSSPPGFPLLLAPILKVFGLNFIALKSLNIVFWFLSIFVLFQIFKRVGGDFFAGLTTLILSFSSYFFIYKQNVLTDFPFLFFVCLSIFLLNCSIELKNFILALFVMSVAVWVRSAGGILFLAAFVYYIFILRNFRMAAWCVAVYLLNQVLLGWFTGGFHLGTAGEALLNPLLLFSGVLKNFSLTFQGILYLLCPPQTFLSSIAYQILEQLIKLAAPFLYLGLLWSFIVGLRKRTLSFIECFSFLYLNFCILWSGIPVPVDWFARYTLPLIPFVFIGTYLLFERFNLHSLLRIFFSVILVLNIINVILMYDFNDDSLRSKSNAEMMTWVKDNTQNDQHFMFWKPRAVALMTGRVGTAPWFSNEQRENILSRIEELNISCIILLKSQDGNFISYLEQTRQYQQVWENSVYKIFKPL
jgi:hypothetical protein